MSRSAIELEKWWESEHRLVNGVFKGGGARGVAYAGALRAVEGDGTWFGAVAGASAGAITAALVSAGLTPDELEEATSDALEGVRRRLLWSILTGSTIYDPGKLYGWLDSRLRERVRGESDDETPVSFAQLVQASGIDLFVVAMDLHTKAPVILSADLTPNVSVAAAVLASSAIPGTLPAGRSIVRSNGSAFVDQLVDGGSYANFPQFVFTSPSFRSWYQAQAHAGGDAPAEEQAPAGETAPAMAWAERDTYGFVLDDELVTNQASIERLVPPDAPRTEANLDRGTSATSGQALEYLLSDVVSGHPGRLAIFAAAIILLAAILWAGPTVIRSVSLFSWEQLGRFWPLVSLSITFTLTLAIATLAALSTAVVMFGRVASTTVVPAALAALGVATGVPPWVGSRWTVEAQGGGHDVKVLRVPARGAQTLSFRLGVADRQHVVRAAEESVGFQLVFPDRVRSRPGGHDEPLGLAGKFMAVVLALAAVAALTGSVALLVTSESLAPLRRAGVCVASVLATGISGYALWQLLRRGAARARMRAAASMEDAAKEGRRAWQKTLGGLLLVGIAVAGSQWIGQISRSGFQTARITDTVEYKDGQYYYITLDAGADPRLKYGLQSSSSLRVRDRILVSRDHVFRDYEKAEEDRELSTALPLAKPFALHLAVAAVTFLLAGLGIALMVSARKDIGLIRHRRLATSDQSRATEAASIPSAPASGDVGDDLAWGT
jgi:predicted acylesterase/phospholipase RssA